MVFGLPVAGTSEPLNVALVYNIVLLALTCIVSTLVCWVIVRRRDEPERIPA
jgi:hypothetical protein